MRYSAEEKVLHFLIAGGMIVELILENWMQRPKSGETITTSQVLFFGAHEFIGVSILVIVMTRFMLMIGNRKDFLRLFPWFDKGGCQSLVRELKSDLPGWFSGKLKDTGEQDFLAKSVHGLGLLLALGLGLTGLLLFIEISPKETISALGNGAMEVHDVMGTLLWIFISGHIAMAIYHQLLGHRVLQYIFWVEKQ